ncbi:MAG: sensor histidine kinase [Deltaproteobacteria bacterium]|nr:sensor histidine kinase [Deltaproteobacteria bacterium]
MTGTYLEANSVSCFLFADGTHMPVRPAVPRALRFAEATDGGAATTAHTDSFGVVTAASLMAAAERVVAQSDPADFLAAWLDFEAATNRELISRLDRGATAAELLAWLETALLPACRRIDDGMGQWSSGPDLALQRIAHDVAHRVTDVYVHIPSDIERGRWDDLRALCAPASTSLRSLAQRLKAAFGDRIAIAFHGLEYLSLAAAELAEAVRALAENCIRNAIAHPGSETQVCIDLERVGNRLSIQDNATGIAPEALERLRAGERIHDGRPVAPEDRHGLGWASIRTTCARFGIAWAIESTVGEGTTVTFTFPANSFRPAPDFSIADEIEYRAADLPALLSSFTSAGKVQAAVQLFDYVDTVYADCCRRMEWAGTDQAEWQRVSDWIRVTKAKLRAAELAIGEGLTAAPRALVIAFSSSWTQAIEKCSAVAFGICEAPSCGESGDIPSRVTGLRNRSTHARGIDATREYRVTTARSELAGLFLAPLLRSAAAQTWDGTIFTLQYPSATHPTDASYLHRHIDWTRPGPDPILAAVAQALGWTITSEMTTTGLVIRLDFGATAV